MVLLGDDSDAPPSSDLFSAANDARFNTSAPLPSAFEEPGSENTVHKIYPYEIRLINHQNKQLIIPMETRPRKKRHVCFGNDKSIMY